MSAKDHYNAKTYKQISFRVKHDDPTLEKLELWLKRHTANSIEQGAESKNKLLLTLIKNGLENTVTVGIKCKRKTETLEYFLKVEKYAQKLAHDKLTATQGELRKARERSSTLWRCLILTTASLVACTGVILLHIL